MVCCYWLSFSPQLAIALEAKRSELQEQHRTSLVGRLLDTLTSTSLYIPLPLPLTPFPSSPLPPSLPPFFAPSAQETVKKELEATLIAVKAEEERKVIVHHDP